MNSTSGCSTLATARSSVRMPASNRRCASTGVTSTGGSCGPISSSSSGTSSASAPADPRSSSSSTARTVASSGAGRVSTCRTSSPAAWTKAAYGQVAPVEVELAGREPAVGRGHRPLEFVDEPRLSDARVAGDEHQVLLALGGGREAVEQGGQLGVASEQHVGDPKPRLDVVVARAGTPASGRSRMSSAIALQVGRHRRCGGVAVLGILVEQPVEQVGEQRWAPRPALVQARWAAGDVRVDQRTR